MKLIVFKKIIICFFIFTSHKVSCQTQAQNKIVPPPPEVASLIKFANVPVNTYNGTSQYSIPLHKISEGDLSFELLLSYYSNGFKVAEESSWVGFGWTLNGPGVIHLHKGTPDAEKLSDPPIPYYLNNPIYQDPNQPNSFGVGCTFRNSNGDITIYDEQIVGSENKYDLYSYNFAGYSGKFIRTNSNELVPVDRSNIIFKNIDGGNSLEAITPDGTKYIFQTVGISNTPYLSDPCGPLPGNYITQDYTYYLDKIISPTKREINFSYIPYTSRSIPVLSQTSSKTKVSSVSFNNSYESRNDITFSGSATTHNNYLLNEINTENSRITFGTSLRQDVENGRRLDRIMIYKKDEVEPAKIVYFKYNYFQGVSNYGDWTTLSGGALGFCGVGAPYNPTIDLKSKRLKLNSVRFIDHLMNSHSPGYPEYFFEYNESVNLPYKTSLSQDLWGYFNGNISNSLLPNLDYLGYYDQDLPLDFINQSGTANRSSNEHYMEAAMLTKITQPTGGYTKLDYEINTFDDLPGTSQRIIDKLEFATDYGVGKDVTYFEVQDVGLIDPLTNEKYNPGVLSVTLMCQGNSGCNSGSMGDCHAFSGHPQDGLYALIQRQKPNGNWETEIFDKFSTLTSGNPCGINNLSKRLKLGNYRITANFPDDEQGALGYGMATISLEYKKIVDSNNSNNVGGGLRIKSIADYDNTDEKYNEKKYTYTGGKMITKPIFYSNFNLENAIQQADFNGAYQNCTFIAVAPTGGGVNNCYEGIRHETTTLYSNPVVQYSHNASGAVVGYDEVAISYGLQAENGQEIIKYKNQSDRLYHYDGMLPGISGVRALDNGKIKEKIVLKNTTPNLSEPILKKVLSEKYEYQIHKFRDYWAYKSNYYDKKLICSGNLLPMSGIGYNYNFLHFYPIKIGRAVAIKKIVTNYDLITEEPTLISTTRYNYNSKIQLKDETTSTSVNGISLRTKYQYPYDLQYLPTLYQQPYMSNLVNKNQINPIITTKKYKVDENGIEYKLSEFKTKYESFNGNILPMYIFSNKDKDDIDDSIHLKITYTKYDINGNLLESKINGNKYVSFIWGYNNQYPIAKIENAAYSQISSQISNIQAKSNADNDRTIGNTGNEGALRAALNNLRTLSALSDAMITTYTYDPLIGVTSITDPMGNVVYYEYDELNRLKFIKDRDGNLVSENKYHYKNQ